MEKSIMDSLIVRMQQFMTESKQALEKQGQVQAQENTTRLLQKVKEKLAN